jgi:hypothetical protein
MRPQDRDGLGSDAGPALSAPRKGRYPHHLHPDIQRSLISVQMLTAEYAGVQVSGAGAIKRGESDLPESAITDAGRSTRFAPA